MTKKRLSNVFGIVMRRESGSGLTSAKSEWSWDKFYIARFFQGGKGIG
jgi:hypothetical protein